MFHQFAGPVRPSRRDGVRAFLAVVAVAGLPLRASAGQSAGSASPEPPGRETRPALSRVFVEAGGGYRVSRINFDETHTEEVFVEPSTWKAQYHSRQTPLVDGGLAVRIAGGFLAGVNYSRHQESEPVSISAQIPHPFFFNQPRTVEGTSTPLASDEQAIHIGLSYLVPAGRHLEVAVSGGPSIFRSKRSFVKDIQVGEEYPFDTATFQGVTAASVQRTAYGGHAAADVTWLFTPRVGIGALVRVSRGSLKFATPSGGSVSVDAGGVQVVAGVRLRFGGAASSEPPPARTGAPGTGETDRPAQQETQPYLRDRGRSGVVASAAPVFLLPDARRVPLRTLPAGTVVRVLEETGDWFKVEFPDRQLGPRTGYIESRYVEVRK